MNVKDSIRRHAALLSIVIMAFACGQANSRSPAPAPSPAPSTTPAPKKPKKIATGTRTTPAVPPPAAAPTASPTPPANTVSTIKTKTLSGDFSVNCARCHGQNGDGRVNIIGKTYQEYKGAVRSGRGAMPAFSESQYSDASLNNDHSVLSGN